jgi:dihydroxyacetone kinase
MLQLLDLQEADSKLSFLFLSTSSITESTNANRNVVSEPMFSGFVGSSFLSASVSGNVFASPTAAQIFEAIKLCQPPNSTSKGTLIVCGNYTGDILNAGLAITRATAAGYKVRFTPVGDDVAVGRKKGGKVGRRGLSGHVVGLKIACALADQGQSLERVGDVMEYIAVISGTIAVAFDRYV